jgi:hypothetical protein
MSNRVLNMLTLLLKELPHLLLVKVDHLVQEVEQDMDLPKETQLLLFNQMQAQVLLLLLVQEMVLVWTCILTQLLMKELQMLKEEQFQCQVLE